MRTLPPMTALVAFDAVARTGSVAQAAQEIGRTHGAVSKQIRKLADDMGAPLFKKQGTGLKLTAAGRTLARIVQGALDDLEDGWKRLQVPSTGTVELAMGSTLALRWLMPRLPRFLATHPEVDVNLRFHGLGGMKLTSETCHVVIRMGDVDWDGHNAQDYQPLGDMRWGLVCSPALELNASRQPIGVFGLHHTGEESRLGAWASLAGVEIHEQGSRQLPQLALISEAVANAMGVAILEKRLILEELEDGRLVAPFGFLFRTGALGAYVTEENIARSDVQVLLAWLREEAQQDV